MNILSKSMLVLVATVVFAVLSSGRAEAGHDRWSISYSNGGHYGPSYGVSFTSGGYIHPDYLRPGRYGYRAYGVYPHPRNYVVRAPWCPTHRLNHHHGYHHDRRDRYDDGRYYRNWDDDRRYGRGYRHGHRDGRGYRHDRYDRRW